MTLQGIQPSFLPEVAPYWLANPGAVQCDRSDFSGSQAQPGNLNPEALPPDWGSGRQSLPSSVSRPSRETRIADLQQQRQQLHQSDLAPATAWLEKAKCHKRECYQWYWRSDKPIFNGKKRCYVGMDGSVAVAVAQQAIARRRELDRVERQLKKLEGTHADAT